MFPTDTHWRPHADSNSSPDASPAGSPGGCTRPARDPLLQAAAAGGPARQDSPVLLHRAAAGPALARMDSPGAFRPSPFQQPLQTAAVAPPQLVVGCQWWSSTQPAEPHYSFLSCSEQLAEEPCAPTAPGGTSSHMQWSEPSGYNPCDGLRYPSPASPLSLPPPQQQQQQSGGSLQTCSGVSTPLYYGGADAGCWQPPPEEGDITSWFCENDEAFFAALWTHNGTAAAAGGGQQKN